MVFILNFGSIVAYYEPNQRKFNGKPQNFSDSECLLLDSEIMNGKMAIVLFLI